MQKKIKKIDFSINWINLSAKFIERIYGENLELHFRKNLIPENLRKLVLLASQRKKSTAFDKNIFLKIYEKFRLEVFKSSEI